LRTGSTRANRVAMTNIAGRMMSKLRKQPVESIEIRGPRTSNTCAFVTHWMLIEERSSLLVEGFAPRTQHIVRPHAPITGPRHGKFDT
jgi:hypothetical protein